METISRKWHQGAKKMKEVSENEKRCFNCNQRDHMNMACPTKREGLKCFKCSEHIASKCIKQCENFE